VSPSREVIVVDHGRGNLFSVCQAVAKVGGAPRLTADPDVVATAPRLILPGVGAFGDAMAGLRALGLEEAVNAFAATGRPLLGICLGMELLLDESSEFGRHAGLGLIPGKVDRLPAPDAGRRDKIPNVGWCPLREAEHGPAWSDTIFTHVKAGDFVYFVHSFAAYPADPRHRLADIVFADTAITAAVTRDNVTGCQFHPEKSGEVGLAILRSFVNGADGGSA
jgi:imidazole glycerol-phosphate synthase subunit HisH